MGGADPERLGKVRRYAASMNLAEPCVKFTGAISGDEVASQMKRMRCCFTI